MKINRHHIFILFILLLAFSACFRRENPDNFLIKGIIDGAEGQKIYLEELTVNQLNRIDSADTGADGRFEFSKLPKETGFYLLKLENGKFITLNIGKGEKNEIHADVTKFPDEYVVTGTSGSTLLQEYFTKTAVNQHKLDSLSQIFVTGQGADNFYQIKQQIDSSFYQLFSNQKLFLRNLLSENPGSMASLLLLNQRFANKILLDEAENFYLFVKIDSNLFAKYPTNSHVAKHHERVLKITRQKAEQAKSEALLAPGNPAPVLNLRAVSGQTVSLASFKGKMVLLNFWASWSPPCRAANIQLNEIYQKYHSGGFEIFGVSFDTNPDIWKKSVEIDKLQWPNVSDLSGINSPVRKLYNLPENLPYFYLVDKDGKILAKGFTVAQLKAILKEKLD
jgi:peroxiredoxin